MVGSRAGGRVASSSGVGSLRRSAGGRLWTARAVALGRAPPRIRGGRTALAPGPSHGIAAARLPCGRPA
eukprot:14918326-Alexandrium_andersonii.AAC.1